jgi:Membrane transport protein
MALGYDMRKIDILSSEADRLLTRLVVTLLAPCLAFDTIIGNEGLANPKNWILPPILGFASIALGILVSRFGVRCFRIPEGNASRTLFSQLAFTTTAASPFRFATLSSTARPLACSSHFFSASRWPLEYRCCTTHRPFSTRTLAPGNQCSHRCDPAAIALNALGAKAWIPSSVARSLPTMSIGSLCATGGGRFWHPPPFASSLCLHS